MDPIFSSDLPRYSVEPFPAYRYLPFLKGMPHPRRDPAGHSYGKEEAYLDRFDPQDWDACQPYLYGVDLFNHGYWWEAHEAWEGLWLAAGRDSLAGQFLQGLIQLAAAQLKRFSEEKRGATMLTETAVGKLALAGEEFLGIHIAKLCSDAWRCLHEDKGEYPSICLPPGTGTRK